MYEYPMKKLFKDIISIRKDLTIILFVVISVIILEVSRSEAKLNAVISGLCLSYISAFIFYFLVVHLKQQRDKDNIYQYIARRTYIIVSDTKSLISSFKKESRIGLKSEYPTEEELEEVCKKINPNSNAPLLIGGLDHYASWIQYLNYHKDRAENAIKKIYVGMQYLDSNYIKLLMGIEDCVHFKVIDVASKMPMRNVDLTAFARQLYKYFELVRKLELYANKNFKAYKIK